MSVSFSVIAVARANAHIQRWPPAHMIYSRWEIQICSRAASRLSKERSESIDLVLMSRGWQRQLPRAETILTGVDISSPTRVAGVLDRICLPLPGDSSAGPAVRTNDAYLHEHEEEIKVEDANTCALWQSMGSILVDLVDAICHQQNFYVFRTCTLYQK